MDLRENLGIFGRALGLQLDRASRHRLSRLAQYVDDIYRAAGARAHEHELHGTRSQVAAADVGRAIDDDRVAGAALRDERHSLHQLDPGLHGCCSSSTETSPSHFFVTLQPTASSAGPTKRPMNPNA